MKMATELEPIPASKGEPGMGFKAPLKASITYPETVLWLPSVFRLAT